MKFLVTGVLICLSFYFTSAWIPRIHVNSLWPPNRRSSRCVPSNGQCLTTSQCCEMSEVCSLDYSVFAFKGERRIGHCKRLEQPAIGQYPLRDRGEPCSESSECNVGLCCRETYRHRMGPSLHCGEPEGPVICIEHARVENEIYSN